MLRRTVPDFASKSSGTSAMYQARPPRKKPKQFHVILGEGVSKREMIKEQKNRFTAFFERQPLYLAGKNAWMHPKTYTIRPSTDGIVFQRDSKINPNARRWLDVEPDVQKIARSRKVRNDLSQLGMSSNMFKHNKAYTSERHDVESPDWRIEAQKEMKLTERFKDPNLFTRGIETSLKPLDKYFIA
eukprot:GILI01029765.1.p1 GENE.GILI01029765.1~~GILI01029765.1.p1  ORF type:complete len:186 (+),score=31.03 GILI01029765.1:95-652(+)